MIVLDWADILSHHSHTCFGWLVGEGEVRLAELPSALFRDSTGRQRSGGRRLALQRPIFPLPKKTNAVQTPAALRAPGSLLFAKS